MFSREQILAGRGAFMTAAVTLIWRVGPDQYLTSALRERPSGPAVLVGYGRRQRVGSAGGQRYRVEWLDGTRPPS